MTFVKNGLILLLIVCMFACSETEEVTTPEPETSVLTEHGTVSGYITDVGTGNRIPGSTVTLLEETMETGVDGGYSFQGILYGTELTLDVMDPDYQSYSQPFTLQQERLIIDVALTPAKDTSVELQEFLDEFSDLLTTVDPENLEKIQTLFSESYVAADDPATLFGVASGIVPENYKGVVPAITQLFEEYTSLQFLFQDVEMDITHARKATLTLHLDIDAEIEGDPDLRTLMGQCQFGFRREGMDWKIVYWQLLALDIRL